MTKRALALLATLTVTLAACSHAGVAPGQARLTVGKGSRVTVAHPGRPARPVSGSSTLHGGDRVRVTRGVAQLALPGHADLELRGPRSGRVGTDLRVATVPVLLAGDLLVRRTQGAVTVSASGSEATVRNGAARLSRQLAVTAAAYVGQVTLKTAGRSLAVPALRQATIPVLGVLPGRPSPLALDATDPWDNRFLGLAIDLSQQLQQQSDGFSSTVASGEGHSVGFFKQILPALDQQPAFGPDLVDAARPAGETLVGAAIAVTGTRGDFPGRWGAVFSFRNEGAAWGLVALDQAVTDAPRLSSAVQAALGRATFQPASLAARGGSSTGGGQGTTPSGPGGGTSPTTTPTTQPGSPPTTQPPNGPVPTPTPPVTTPVDPVVKQVVQAINNLLGG